MKYITKEKHISAQLIMQNFMLERLLERISVSKYQQNFILKGGFLITAIVGLDTRATMDMDVTIKGLPINEQTVQGMFEEICNIELTDDVTFSFRSMGEIREGDEYTRYRVSLSTNYNSNMELYALKAALNATTEKRGSTAVVKDYHKIMDTVRSSEIMQKQWNNYQKDFEYATHIAFVDVCDVIVELMDNLINI